MQNRAKVGQISRTCFVLLLIPKDLFSSFFQKKISRWAKALSRDDSSRRFIDSKALNWNCSFDFMVSTPPERQVKTSLSCSLDLNFPSTRHHSSSQSSLQVSQTDCQILTKSAMSATQTQGQRAALKGHCQILPIPATLGHKVGHLGHKPAKFQGGSSAKFSVARAAQQEDNSEHHSDKHSHDPHGPERRQTAFFRDVVLRRPH
jgi:hypothetical protein